MPALVLVVRGEGVATKYGGWEEEEEEEEEEEQEACATFTSLYIFFL